MLPFIRRFAIKAAPVCQAAFLALFGAAAMFGPAAAESPVELTIFGAGTLAVPFKQIDAAFEKKYPGIVIRPQFGGSVMMAKKIAELHQPADLLAVADYSVIPKYLSGKNGAAAEADWFIGFAGNAITFVYTDKSEFGKEITAENWYDYLSRPGVQIGRSNPDTDPSGYQTLQMLALAEKYYRAPGLTAKVLANSPPENLRDTETSLVSALQLGQIDYLAIYRSDARQHGLKFLDLPPQVNLSDPAYARDYATAIAHTKNGDLPGKPIVYAVTIPSTAEHRGWAEKYIQFLLGREGQEIMAANGFGTVNPAYAENIERVPEPIRALVKAWPGS